MGRSMIFLVAAFGILTSMAGTRMMLTSVSSEGNAAGNYSRTQARNIAKSGIEFAIMQLDSNKWWRRGYLNLPMAGGNLDVALSTIDSANVRVRSVGSFMDQIVPILTVIYVPERTAPLPDWLKGAIVCDQTMNLIGNTIVTPFNPAGRYNANIHANNSVNLQGSTLVNGYATYATGSFTATPMSNVEGFLKPFFPESGRPLYAQAPLVDVPTLLLSQKTADYDEYYPGDMSLTGSKILGTMTKPRRIYVGGSLSISGNVAGYGFFYVKQGVNFNGDVSLNYPPTTALQNLGLYCEQDINFNGNVKVCAQIWTNGTLNCSGNVEFAGSVASRQSINWTGSVLVKYLPANGLLLPGAWKIPAGEKRPDLSSYWE